MRRRVRFHIASDADWARLRVHLSSYKEILFSTPTSTVALGSTLNSCKARRLYGQVVEMRKVLRPIDPVGVSILNSAAKDVRTVCRQTIVRLAFLALSIADRYGLE